MQGLLDQALDREPDLGDIKDSFFLHFKDFQEALVRCTLSAAALHTRNFTGSTSRLQRFMEALIRHCVEKVKNSQNRFKKIHT